MRPTLAAALLSITVGATACAPGHPGWREVLGPPVAAPSGQVVFQVSGAAGLAPLDFSVAARPSVTIYGSGAAYVIRPDQGAGRYPGRPLAFAKGTVPRATLAELMRAAQVSGLFDGADFGAARIFDAGGTTVTFHPGRSVAHRTSVDALHVESADESLSAEQRSNRVTLRAFEGRLHDSVVLPDAQAPAPWIPSRIDVTASSQDPRDDAAAIVWPGPALDTLLTSTGSGRCGALAGPVATRIYALARARGTTHWQASGTDRYLIIRALLPGEPGCGR